MYLHDAGLQSGRNFKEAHTNQADRVVTHNSVPGSEDIVSEQKKRHSDPKNGSKIPGNARYFIPTRLLRKLFEDLIFLITSWE
jgi:hypothetical protein